MVSGGMAYTQAQLDALTKSLAMGAMKVKYEDREVTYMSLEQMRSLKREMEAELGLSTESTNPRRRMGVYDNGLGG